MQRRLESLLFASRWLMAPFYVGLVLTLLLLLFSFAKEIVHVVGSLSTLTEADVMLAILSLIDMSLAANLVIMVVFSGYENFVSQMRDVGEDRRPEWMGTIDFSGMKLKLLGSIVAISAIHLLKLFMNIQDMSDRQLAWATGIHLVFVISGVFLALADKISHDDHRTNADEARH